MRTDAYIRPWKIGYLRLRSGQALEPRAAPSKKFALLGLPALKPATQNQTTSTGPFDCAQGRHEWPLFHATSDA